MKIVKNFAVFSLPLASIAIFTAGCKISDGHGKIPGLYDLLPDSAIVLNDARLAQIAQDFDKNKIVANNKWAGKKYTITGTLMSALYPPASTGSKSRVVFIEPPRPSAINYRIVFAVFLKNGSPDPLKSATLGDSATAIGTLCEDTNDRQAAMRTFSLIDGQFAKAPAK